MSDVKKIATRESYGRTLVELGKENDKIVVLMQTWRNPPRPVCLRRRSLSATLTAVLPKPI